ncbi:hypothetical protein FHS19_003097 [Paenibacillus rhizosphaerae]|uniref:ChbG/HpnK family deacetylase n=1 Tax=Paenibacillus rhizosphaerae TaxID=297318 RepID=A0A839TPL7_9BACL|nr:ChbG/HpnK family deacetylase [Paenibacillus rhizosphaerae]MBB3128443.1 hypothetical protein [Paenibacillus rhizosphaerae]
MNQNTTCIRLITRADDAGSAESADRAILETIERGIVRNVSLMAVGPSIEHAARLLASHRDVCFGLHATLNAEWTDVRWGPLSPISCVPSLVEADSGMFTPSPHSFLDRPPVMEEILSELRVQLERLRGLGFRIGYADTHMVFEWALPSFNEIFDYWCSREGIRNYRRFSRRLPLPPVSASTAGEGRVEELVDGLRSAPPGQYLLVGHPGFDEEDMRRFGAPDYPSGKVVADRIGERLMFTHPEVLQSCVRLGVRPIRYDEAEPIT